MSPGRGRTAVDLIGAGAAALTFAGMVATPLARPRGSVRRRAASLVVGGLAASCLTALTRRWGGRAAARTAAAIAPLTWAAELAGSRTGVPFGRYAYTDRLRPQLAGVPVIVPTAWLAMAPPAREAAHALLGPRSTPATRIVGGSLALAAWDLFLDPQMTAEGFWRWAAPAAGGTRLPRYRGIPLVNFAGWVLVGAAVMAVLERTCPAQEDADGVLVGTYTYVAAMEALGFAAFFRDRVVAAAGTAGMGPVAVGAAVRVVRGARRRRQGR